MASATVAPTLMQPPSRPFYNMMGFFQSQQEGSNDRPASFDSTYGSAKSRMSPETLKTAELLWPYVLWQYVPKELQRARSTPKAPYSLSRGIQLPPNGITGPIGSPLLGIFPSDPIPGKNPEVGTFDPYELVRKAAHGEFDLKPNVPASEE